MSKYQEYQNALNYITSEVFTGGNSILEMEAEAIKKLLQPLIDQTKTPTKKEIIKEWKKLGYKWLDGKNCLSLFKADEVILGFAKTINISFVRKHYSAVYEENMYDEECYTCGPCDITFQEHQLLTKTFKWLGWE